MNRKLSHYIKPDSLGRIAGLILTATGFWLVWTTGDWLEGATPVGLGLGILGIRAKQERQ